VTADDIITFATQFDPQPFHTDPDAAATSVFGGLVASGWHTAAISMSLFVTSEFNPAGGLIGAGVEMLEWPRPVRPGDTLTVETVVLSTRPSRTQPQQGMLTVRSTTLNQQREAVQIFVPKMIVQRRPGVADAT
jgi:acyl dehydratase